ncbi:hypothetical protein HKBW3S43_01281, partial [Candidatus Hakubella thermalkaliphila]
YKEETKRGDVEANSFYQKWLKVLFLEAFNNRFGHPHWLPRDVRDVLQLAPYLNGGLFRRNTLDNLLLDLSDNVFEEIFAFFEKYNFTIREDLPLDVEVAVDPQMIGYVYESLANVAEEIYERQDFGIFYTPRVEVDFMCRRALAEYLGNHLSEIPKAHIYRLLFDEDKSETERYFTEKGLWYQLEELLDNLAVLDPACGSGAFLVGMLFVLTEIYKTIFAHIDRQMTDYELKKRIVGMTLYGVDVMPWAVHSAELRLWLQLMIESDLTLGDLKIYPLLPNLNLKLRVGDSLVQEIGGMSLHFRDASLPLSVKRKLGELKREKEKYYNSDPTAKFKTEEAILHEELRVFDQILGESIVELQKGKQKLEQIPLNIQPDLYGEVDATKLTEEREKIEHKKRKIEEEIERLREIRGSLAEPGKKPLVWDIDFAEIFGDKGGFDIVIGNPPYVRQEKIAPPNRLRNEISGEDKRQYKEKLVRSVKTHLLSVKNIDRKSDYYVYFYFHGLSLLNEKGVFCFITSNSWLDVGYGRDLQEFLLKYVPIKAIYDNQAKRSFEHADVNTIIALFGAPQEEQRGQYKWPALSNTAKFVMFKKPFEEVLNSENLIEIEMHSPDEASLFPRVLNTPEFRVYPIKQENLLEEGWEYPEDQDRSLLKGKFESGRYVGNKWGGKCLKAPDIFFTILEKGKGKLVRLGDIAEVRRGFTTGANEFFYVEDVTERIGRTELPRIQNQRHFRSLEEIAKAGLRVIRPSKFGKNTKDYLLFLVEAEYLKPVIKSPRELKTIVVREDDLKYRVIMCHRSREELRKEKAFILDYIRWGEKQAYHKRPTCAGRPRWWDLGIRECPNIVWVKSTDDTHRQGLLPPNTLVDQRLYEVYSQSLQKLIIALNSSVFSLLKELEGRANLGEGVLDTAVYEAKRVEVLDPEAINGDQELLNVIEQLSTRSILSIFSELGLDQTRPIREQEPSPLPDRKALDEIVFDALNLTQEERKEVYWSVAELVKNRLEKARSV